MHLGVIKVTTANREGLVEQRQRVARRTPGAPRDEIQRLLVGIDAFARQDVGEVTDHFVVREQRELEVLRA